MTKSEHFALGQWLSDYPKDMMYEKIIERLNVPNEWKLEDITVRGLVENITTEQVAEIIRDTKEAYEMSIK
jgi:hypothetical protein